MKLLGNRLLLELPPKEESKIIVDENTKEALTKEMLKKFSKLKVKYVGDAITSIKEGDYVLADPQKVTNAYIISVEGENLALISNFDVILVW